MSQCQFKPRTFAQAEVGCPLDHCSCGEHIIEGKEHKCEVPCDGTCEPMCKWCNEQANLAADIRQSEWEGCEL